MSRLLVLRGLSVCGSVGGTASEIGAATGDAILNRGSVRVKKGSNESRAGVETRQTVGDRCILLHPLAVGHYKYMSRRLEYQVRTWQDLGDFDGLVKKAPACCC